MELIKNILAREILDSRGNPTIEVEIETNRMIARACVPSGASTGTYEAMELRDGDKSRYHGKGVTKAIENIDTIIKPQFVQLDMNILEQEIIDNTLITIDGTDNKRKLGANTILAVSLAFAKAKSFSLHLSLYKYFSSLIAIKSPIHKGKIILPVPMLNIINGGRHSDAGLDFEEFMIIPVGAPTFKEAIRYGSEIFQTLQSLLEEKGLSTAVGDEGGFSPRLKNNEEALDILLQAIEKTGYKTGKDIFLGLNMSASNFYHKETHQYTLTKKNTVESLSTKELIDYYLSLLKKYPILSIEDPFDENDWAGFKALTHLVGTKIQIAGGDLFATNVKRIEKGIQEKSANGVVIKFNQIGTITETIRAVEKTHRGKWTSIIANRSGETEDTTIADLVVGLGTGQIKTGSVTRSERVAKYNQLLRIEEKEGKNAIYPGRAAFYNI